jgi:hypothetical protein
LDALKPKTIEIDVDRSQSINDVASSVGQNTDVFILDPSDGWVRELRRASRHMARRVNP